MMAAVVAVLKAGGAYVPFDPYYPERRLNEMFDDAQIAVMLTSSGMRDRWRRLSCNLVFLDDATSAWHAESASNPDPSSRDDRLAYIIYTSGSTGQPKGVAMGQPALVNLIRWQLGASTAPKGARTLQYSSLGFDVSFQEMFATWCSGGELVLIQESLRHEPSAMVDYMTRHRVQRLFVPFIALQRIADAAEGRSEVLPDLCEVITAGEQLRITPRIAGFFQQRPRCVLQNHYGPTESHVVTAYVMDGPATQWPALPPIGQPIENTYVRILDEQLQPVAVGDVGELFIGGSGLARGYINRPELTAQRFIADPWGNPGSRLYRTGDLAKQMPDGNYEFLGRADYQVKISGYRVELGEIEAHLSQAPGVREVVVTCPTIQGERRLVAYLVFEGDARPANPALRAFLLDRLPAYMIPSAFVILDALPLSPNGKVDRQALPAPPTDRPDLGFAAVAPRSNLEREIAEVWGEVLGISRVGTTDTFGDLGGNSLQAADMFVAVRRRLGRQPPTSALTRELTVAKLAAILDSGHSSVESSALVPLRPKGNRFPLYLVHGIGGQVLNFAPLVNHLGDNQPVFGLQVPVTGAAGIRFSTIEEMAARYMREVLQLGMAGPFQLGGFSLGGTVAFEMAQQLTAAGHRVSKLIIIDEPATGLGPPPPQFQSVARFLRNLGPWFSEEMRHNTAKQMVTRFRRKILNRLRRSIPAAPSQQIDQAHRDVSAWIDPRLPAEFRSFCEHNYRILMNYRPKRYRGSIVVIRASAQPLFSTSETDLGWGRLAEGGVVTHVIRGSHDSILREPDVGRMADALRSVLAAGPI
jgi:amino acid adenylation domain-containing protein